MARFVVRYRGKGARPGEMVERLRAIAGASVIDDTGRMMLLDAPEHALRSALASDPDWVIAPEVGYGIPDTRKRIEKPASDDR